MKQNVDDFLTLEPIREVIYVTETVNKVEHEVWRGRVEELKSIIMNQFITKDMYRNFSTWLSFDELHGRMENRDKETGRYRPWIAEEKLHFIKWQLGYKDEDTSNKVYLEDQLNSGFSDVLFHSAGWMASKEGDLTEIVKALQMEVEERRMKSDQENKVVLDWVSKFMLAN